MILHVHTSIPRSTFLADMSLEIREWPAIPARRYLKRTDSVLQDMISSRPERPLGQHINHTKMKQEHWRQADG
jgi:hypothetical protein